MTAPLPTRADIKARAKALRAALAREGRAISHGQALDLLARQMGDRDWNALSARLDPVRPALPAVGDRVTGRYLGQRFTGHVVRIEPSARNGRRVSLALDRPVDTVRFSSFGNLRRRVTADFDRNGQCRAMTSDGQPHLEFAPS